MNTKTLPFFKISPIFLVIIFYSICIRLAVIGNLSLIPEEAYYWNYANHLDWSYFDHPPMVAYLIKISTLIFGTKEFAVRLPAIFCWSIASIFSCKLSNLIDSKSGIYAIFILAILPFFFIQSVIMTPDMPLIACWSACLYYLYKILVKDEKKAWYALGFWFGFGIASKYTLVLLVPTTFLFILFDKKSAKNLLTPYPYLAAIIACIIFSPVLYWNAQHNWASFSFQTTQRFSSSYQFSLHEVLGLLVLFLTPVGIKSFYILCNHNLKSPCIVKRFLQIFSLFPLGFFLLFSIFHTTKFNWIGPGLLASVPWIAHELALRDNKIQKNWGVTATLLIIIYTSAFICIKSGQPAILYNAFFQKFTNWDNYYLQIKKIVAQSSSKKQPVVVPLDKYNIASELTFYQKKHHENKFAIYGRNVFGQDALMYNYWYPEDNLQDNNILVIHDDRYMLDADFLTKKTMPITPIKIIWAISQGSGTKGHDYFYQIVKLKH